MQGRDEFARALRELDYEPRMLDGNRIAFPWEIGIGRLSGTRVDLGFEVPPDFRRNLPSGPHVSPRIADIHESAPHHPQRVHKSPFGDTWIYLSRPYPGKWRGTEPLETYLAYIGWLLETL